MKAVGIRLLKSKLSAYLKLVKSGETLLVTDREEVIAEIKPAHRQKQTPQSLEEVLSRWAEQGMATLASEEIRAWQPSKRKLPALASVSSQKILNALRDEK